MDSLFIDLGWLFQSGFISGSDCFIGTLETHWAPCPHSAGRGLWGGGGALQLVLRGPLLHCLQSFKATSLITSRISLYPGQGLGPLFFLILMSNRKRTARLGESPAPFPSLGSKGSELSENSASGTCKEPGVGWDL